MSRRPPGAYRDHPAGPAVTLPNAARHWLDAANCALVCGSNRGRGSGPADVGSCGDGGGICVGGGDSGGDGGVANVEHTSIAGRSHAMGECRGMRKSGERCGCEAACTGGAGRPATFEPRCLGGGRRGGRDGERPGRQGLHVVCGAAAGLEVRFSICVSLCAAADFSRLHS